MADLAAKEKLEFDGLEYVHVCSAIAVNSVTTVITVELSFSPEVNRGLN